jgi:predicted kinase
LSQARPILIASIGLPGSGKTTFLKRFASEQRWFYFRNDDARRRIIKHPVHNQEEHDQLGRLANYLFDQLLGIGISCAYDVNLNQRRHRASYAELAESHGAQFWIVWFKVPIELAKERVTRRAAEAEGEEKAYFNTFRPDLVDHIQQELQLPTPDERVVEIDGTAPYEQQLRQVLAAISPRD